MRVIVKHLKFFLITAALGTVVFVVEAILLFAVAYFLKLLFWLLRG